MGTVQKSEILRFARIALEPNARSGDEVLILTDTVTDAAIAEGMSEAALAIGAEPTIVVIRPRPAPNLEPPGAAAWAARKADLVVMMASQPMLHTEAMRASLASGARFLGVAGITPEIMTQGAATADPQELFEITERVAAALTVAGTARVTSPEGTDITMDLRGRRAYILAGRCLPDSPVACFPDGEAPIAPVEASTEGTIVFDTAMNPFGRLNRPIAVKVESGRIRKIDGGEEARKLEDLLARRNDANSYHIGEFSLGTNRQARVSDNMSEVKRRWGTVHFGLGDNATLGGTNHAAIHLDGLILRPTVTLDAKTAVEDGALKL